MVISCSGTSPLLLLLFLLNLPLLVLACSQCTPFHYLGWLWGLMIRTEISGVQERRATDRKMNGERGVVFFLLGHIEIRNRFANPPCGSPSVGLFTRGLTLRTSLTWTKWEQRAVYCCRSKRRFSPRWELAPAIENTVKNRFCTRLLDIHLRLRW